MENMVNIWPVESIDAVNIRTEHCSLSIQGTPDTQISLEGDGSEKYSRGVRTDFTGRSLNIFASHKTGQGIKLQIPQYKALAIDIFVGHGDTSINNTLANLRMMVGNGDVAVKDFKGKLSIASGHGSIKIQNYLQTIVPEIVNSSSGSSTDSESKSHKDWWHWNDSDWEYWGEELGANITRWAINLEKVFEPVNIPEQDLGLSLQIGKGDVEIEDADAAGSFFKLGNGNLHLQKTTVTRMQMDIKHGCIDCRSIVPRGDWGIKASHGDIRCSIPANIAARLDMATRYGSIYSDMPLVRVSRQGPESSFGNRMVGTIGPITADTLPEIRITTNHGNIDIFSEPSTAQASNKDGDIPASEMIVTAPTDNPTPPAPVVNANMPAPASSGTSGLPVLDTPLAVLQALKDGQITVAEADRLLKNLGA